jgi:hypothetical protein
MKKLLSVVLMLCLLIPAAIAEAPVDVKSLTNDELKALYVDVKTELMERKLWDSAKLPDGVYMAGKGLPEGTYECTLTTSGIYKIFKDYDSFISDNYLEWGKLYEGEMFTMSLYGDLVYFVSFNSIVKPFIGPSW